MSNAPSANRSLRKRARGYASIVRKRRDIDQLHEEVQDLFAELWQVPRFSGLRHGFRPQVDCFHTDDPHALTVVAELPGVEADDVSIAVTERTLTITGERKRPPRVDGLVYQQVEIEYGPFQRQIVLVEDVDPAEATASYRRGLLTIVLPLADRPPERAPVAILVTRS